MASQGKPKLTKHQAREALKRKAAGPRSTERQRNAKKSTAITMPCKGQKSGRAPVF
jgi:hypothetical protein